MVSESATRRARPMSWRMAGLAATKSPGDEKKLMKLADGPKLPGYGRWTALKAPTTACVSL